MSRPILEYGLDAIMVECTDGTEARALQTTLSNRTDPEIGELVPGARTVLITLTGPPSSGLLDFLADGPLDRPQALDSGPVITIPVHYDGDDLDRVAELTGLDPAEVIMTHTDQLWTVAFCGFAPGFGYLVGEHDRLKVPRRPQPRTRVPAGSVALADAYCGIYPRRSPGGWQLIGRTETAIWDQGLDPPALLQPGSRVRFEAIR
ncbi:5-oxoprolinase subunit B family protein [Microlunatus speluncae]|uniref:5-oxoprolinase subunit B family protein n=1 Tax=Microlunatus speluncae TaxID=2594267 RepID=UPI00126652CD|nr:allophanate hydrolase subunit 1 [Microlunatus speluncae]